MSALPSHEYEPDHDDGARPDGADVPAWNSTPWLTNYWSRPEDGFETDLNHTEIRRYANAALRLADVRGIVPTPLDPIREALQLTSTDEIEALAEMPSEMWTRVRKTLRKIRGFVAVKERVVYVDRTLRHSQSRFVLGHEIGHHFMPWQRDAYGYRLETDSTLTPSVRDRFEREANAFSSELLFNIDELKIRSAGAPLSLSTPIELHEQFDASLIATTRRFVESHDASAALLLLGRYPVTSMGKPGSHIMYGVQSPKFTKQFGSVIPGLRLSTAWPWDHHDLAYHSYRAVVGREEPHVRGHYVSHIGAHFNFEVFAARPHPFVLLTPTRRLTRTPRTRILLR
jgi:hypothetical protein